MDVVRRFAPLAVVVAALALPGAAAAHANLVRLGPADGAVLSKSPAAVRVLFDDAVRPGPGGAAIRNGGGSVLARRPYVARGNPRELVVPLRQGLPHGDYSVRWSVVSDDGHNERGVTAFAVGAGAAPPTASLSAGGVGRTRDVAFRVLLFAGLLAAAGAAAFRLLVWPRELPGRSPAPRCRPPRAPPWTQTSRGGARPPTPSTSPPPRSGSAVSSRSGSPCRSRRGCSGRWRAPGSTPRRRPASRGSRSRRCSPSARPGSSVRSAS